MPLSVGMNLPPVPIPTPTRQFDYSYAEWISPPTPDHPLGVAWPLTVPGLGYWLAQGVAGIGSVPVTMSADALPQGGAALRNIRTEPRIITLPIAITPGSYTSFAALEDSLETAFSDTTDFGPGMLRIVRADGTERRILGVYQGGFDNNGDNWSYNVAPVQLYCPDGYFTSPAETVVTSSYNTTNLPYLNRYPRIGSGRVLGKDKITNSGRGVAFPEWTITGPWSAFKVIALNADGTDGPVYFEVIPGSALTAGHSRVITTNPATVVDETGAAKFGELTIPGSTLFKLPRGTTQVRYVATGAGAGTSITCRFLPRFKKA